MGDPTTADRRRFLEGVGIGGGILLAGCTERIGPGGDDAEDQTDSGQQNQTNSSQEGEGDAVAIAAVDQEAMQEEQASIQEDVQNGDMDQEEAQKEITELQEEFVGEALEALTETIEDADDVDVAETFDALGGISIDGESGAVLELLESDDVSGLVSVADAEARAEASTQQG